MSVAPLCMWCLLTNFTGSGGGSGLAASAGFGAGVSAGRPNIGVARSIAIMRVNPIFRMTPPSRPFGPAGIIGDRGKRSRSAAARFDVFSQPLLSKAASVAYSAPMRDPCGHRDRGGVAVDGAAGVGDARPELRRLRQHRACDR